MRRCKKSIRGSTMVEVIVAFAVLCIALACFAGVAGLCLRMVERSSQARQKMETRFGYYYGNYVSDGNDETLYSGSLTFSDGVDDLTLSARLQRRYYGEGGGLLVFDAPPSGGGAA